MGLYWLCLHLIYLLLYCLRLHCVLLPMTKWCAQWLYSELEHHMGNLILVWNIPASFGLGTSEYIPQSWKPHISHFRANCLAQIYLKLSEFDKYCLGYQKSVSFVDVFSKEVCWLCLIIELVITDWSHLSSLWTM